MADDERCQVVARCGGSGWSRTSEARGDIGRVEAVASATCVDNRPARLGWNVPQIAVG